MINRLLIRVASLGVILLCILLAAKAQTGADNPKFQKRLAEIRSQAQAQTQAQSTSDRGFDVFFVYDFQDRSSKLLRGKMFSVSTSKYNMPISSSNAINAWIYAPSLPRIDLEDSTESIICILHVYPSKIVRVGDAIVKTYSVNASDYDPSEPAKEE